MFHRVRVGIAVGLGDGFLTQFLHTVFRIAIFGVFQLNDVAVLLVSIYVLLGSEVYMDVSRLCLLLGDWTVEAVLRSHGQGEAVNEEFALLLVAL